MQIVEMDTDSIIIVDKNKRTFDTNDSELLFRAYLLYIKLNEQLKGFFISASNVLTAIVHQDISHYIPLLELNSGLKIVL